MERFGLYNLLKTFLPEGVETDEKKDEFKDETTPSPSPLPEGNAAGADEKPNACAEFLLRHDDRRKRIKK